MVNIRVTNYTDANVCTIKIGNKKLFWVNKGQTIIKFGKQRPNLVNKGCAGNKGQTIIKFGERKLSRQVISVRKDLNK